MSLANLKHNKFTDEQIEMIAMMPPPQNTDARISYNVGMEFGKEQLAKGEAEHWFKRDLTLMMGGNKYVELGFYAYVGLHRKMLKLSSR